MNRLMEENITMRFHFVLKVIFWKKIIHYNKRSIASKKYKSKRLPNLIHEKKGIKRDFKKNFIELDIDNEKNPYSEGSF